LFLELFIFFLCHKAQISPEILLVVDLHVCLTRRYHKALDNSL